MKNPASEATVVGTLSPRTETNGEEEPEQGSLTRPCRKTPDVIGEQPKESLNNSISEAKVVGALSSPTKTDGEEEKVLSSLGYPRHSDSTVEGLQTQLKKKLAMIHQMFKHPIFRHIPGKPTLANCH